MAALLNPYLAFKDNARQAMEFYADIFGGELTINTFGEYGDTGPNADELRVYWEKLSANGTVTMTLEKQMWGDEFGMCVDEFGVPWMVNITQRS